jgi:hypothetical protein
VTPELINELVRYGILGLILLLIIRGDLATGRELKREQGISDQVIKNNADMAAAMDRLTEAVLRERP